MSNNSANNYTGSPSRPANTYNMILGFPSSVRRNFVSNVILGYEEHVSEEYLEFIVKLIKYYTRLDLSQQFLTNLEQKYKDFISKFDEDLIKIQLGLLSNSSGLVLRIFNSKTFKAIIFSFINFFAHKTVGKAINALDFFFEQLGLFKSDHWMKELLSAHKGNIISKISILMTINKFVILSWNKAISNKNNKKSKPPKSSFDEGRLFAIFQETMFATSLEAILGKSANSFVCNLPGCGDCVTIFKNLKKVFLFTECKKKGLRAVDAIIESESLKGKNRSTQNEALQTDLIKKVDSDIQSRFFSSFVENYCEDKARNKLLTFGILEIPKKLNPPYVKEHEGEFRKIFFNIRLPKNDTEMFELAQPLFINNLVGKKEDYFFKLEEYLKSLTKGNKSCRDVASLPAFNCENKNLSMSNNSVEKWITTQETAKFATEFNISIKEELVKQRKNRRAKDEAALFRDWPVGWMRKYAEWGTSRIWYRLKLHNNAIYFPENKTPSAWVPWEGILDNVILLDETLDQKGVNKKLFKTLIEEYPEGWETISNVNIKWLGPVETCYLHRPSSILLSKQEFDYLKTKIEVPRSINKLGNALVQLNLTGRKKNFIGKSQAVNTNTGNPLNRFRPELQGLSSINSLRLAENSRAEIRKMLTENVFRNVTDNSKAANGARTQSRTSNFKNFTSPFKAQKSKELFSLDPERDPLNDWPRGWEPLSGFENTGQKWFKHPASGMIASESDARLYKSNSKKKTRPNLNKANNNQNNNKRKAEENLAELAQLSEQYKKMVATMRDSATRPSYSAPQLPN